MKVSKIINIGLIVLMVISILLVISLLSNLSDNLADPTMGSWINTNLIWLYIVFIVCVATLVLFAVYNSIVNFKNSKEGLYAVLAIFVLWLITYLVADSKIPKFYNVEKFVADGTITPNIIKWIGGGLIMTYVLFVLALGAMISAPLMRMFRKD